MTDGYILLLYDSSSKFDQLAAGQLLLRQPVRCGKGRRYGPSHFSPARQAGRRVGPALYPSGSLLLTPSPHSLTQTKTLTLSFLSLPASHLCHQGLGSACIIVRSFYLSAINYDPATTDLIFIRVNIYPGPGGGGLTVDFLTRSFYQGHYLPCALTPQY
jgi:hypothetical protein